MSGSARPLLCGWHAVNALCDRDPYPEAELRALNRTVHARERALCPDGRDTAPEAAGNFPLEVLVAALHARGMRTERVRRERPLVGGPLPGAIRGYLVATGGVAHYVAVVRAPVGRPGAPRWVLVDDGVAVARAASPDRLLAALPGGVPPRAVLRVWDRPPNGD